MGGRGIPGRGRGGPRGSPRGSSPAPGGGGDRARGGGFRGRGDFRGGPPGFRGRGRGGPPPPPLTSLGAPRQSAEELARITELEKSIVRFKEVPLSEEHPLRPGFGTLGTKILLRANFFQVQFKKGLIIYDYDVKITPTTGIARLKARIFELLEKNAEFLKFKPFIAHDRSQRMVCPRELPQPLSFDITYVEEEETEPRPNAKSYNVEITKTGELHTEEMSKFLDADVSQRNYDPSSILAALNLVLSMQASRTGSRVGKNRHFFTPEERRMIGPGVEAWRGFYSSIRPVYKNLMVNVNVCMTAFVEGRNLGDAIRDFQHGSRGGFPDLKFMFGKSNIKIRTLHNGYKKPLKAIGHQTAAQQTFLEDGKQTTVANWFRRKYPNLPLQHADRLPVINVASKEKPVWIPAELCEIVRGIPLRGKLTDMQTSTMLQLSCNPPAANAQTIMNEGFQKLGFNPDALGEPISNFGVTISNAMAVIPARILPPPGLSYRNNNRPTTRDGSWNILDVKFHRGGNMENWAVLMVLEQGKPRFKGPTDPEMWKLIQGFRNKCASAGMAAPNEPPRLEAAGPFAPQSDEDPFRQGAVSKLRAAVEKLMNPRPSFILVLLDYRDNYIYPGLKKLCDMELGVATVCMQLNKAMKEQGQDQYFSNVALKVNTKLGGHNHLLDDKDMKWLKQKRTMIVGADVTHPGPTSIDGTPSIAAVVASVDSHFVQYPASIRLQETKKEMVSDMDEMMVERLLLWQKRNFTLPERVFMFRDGVSEGQFETVLREELPLIRKAFDKVYGTGKKPLLTITICGKRHHARFYPMNNEEASRNGNTKPGTIVDKGVTDVFRFDYYLQAHNGLQGTVRPTHYSVIYDENKLQADEIQQGTHTASYQYARATKAVSLIPPAYYADLACERARLYLNDLLNLGLETASSIGGKRGDKKEDEKKTFDRAVAAWGQGVHPNLCETMFYI